MLYAKSHPYERGPLYSLAIKAMLSLILMDLLTGYMTPESHADPDALGKFRNTYYYLVDEDDYANRDADSEIHDIHGETIASVPLAFKKAADIEGTARLRDGRVINFAAYRGGERLYQVVNEEWGLGVKNCELRPFRTIAVDPKRIPAGAVVEIEETKGMVLPDGTIHDGIWRAEDVGSAIQKDRIDLFVGEAKYAKYLQRAGIRNLQPLTVKMVEALPPDSCLR